tara:strand:- start:2698 stop:5037 length:2340 start_codon:yes stop_codon:yes gene_type:complete
VNTAILDELSLLNTALSKEYNKFLTQTLEEHLPEAGRLQVLRIYQAYCYVVEQENYTAFKILNSSNAFKEHFHLIIGFIYSFKNISLKLKYDFCRKLENLFCHIAKSKQFRLEKLKLSNGENSDDALLCLSKFQKTEIDKAKMEYLEGWHVKSKDGKKIEVHLDMIYVKFGAGFTEKVHNAIKNYAWKQKTTSLRTAVKVLKHFFTGITYVYQEKSGESIENILSENRVQPFFYRVYKVLFVQSQASLFCPKNFHKTWASMVYIYTDCFIDSKVFDKPLKPFIIPVWKDPKNNAPTFSIGGDTTPSEKIRWFTNIPLKIKDEEAVSIIQQSLDRDLKHISHVCLVKFKGLLAQEARNKEFIKTGLVKPLNFSPCDVEYYNVVGFENLKNTVATFYKHGINAKQNYLSFLRCHRESKRLNIELNLPSTSTLNVLLTLLVIEHPKITPAWLQKWELFDTNGNMVGYQQTGNQYIAVSHKPRKGSTNAQQEVVLNDMSKSVVEFLIKHTHTAREHLRSAGNTDWRKMILIASTSNSSCLVNLNSTLHAAKDFYDWLQDKSLFDKKSEISTEDAQAISEIHSLRSVRRHRGLQIYLETRSMDIVAEALGHVQKDARLLACYLPKPLMDFFNDRWIRQFQNAILLEAMKDSPYRLEAVNMTAEDIGVFIKNHGISQFPDLSEDHSPKHPKTQDEASDFLVFNQLTYTISTSLLQLLIAIRVIVESSDDEQSFLDIVLHWYQSAVFILDTLDSGKHCADANLMEMLHIANKNQLDMNLIKEALLC